LLRRASIADFVDARLEAEASRMREEFAVSNRVATAVIDDLLPTEIAWELFERFPATNRMVLKRSIKESKFVAAQMNEHHPLLEEAVYAFQDPRVVRRVADITGMQMLEPDSNLYAGGISVMTKGGYLRPHLDNSHDRDQRRYRALNLLYYVTPDWREELGGSLQLWDQGPLKPARTVPSLFNRLVIMVTNRHSWHSVDEIRCDKSRCCISNYYFSAVSPESQEYFHATSFRGEQAGLADLAMQADNLARSTVLKVLPGVYRNPHVYKRRKDA
jgi:Rps23 Pro-64 3,4-dihydroxylase Tpa1-like proline 4-hydroxylase